MKVVKMSTKLIKPVTPTPQNLKNYNISFLDQHMGTMNFAVILFYQSKPQDDCRQLEESLAKILVDCNDQGAELIIAEAQDDVFLIDLVAKIETTQQLNALLIDQYFRTDEAAEDPLLSIQVTNFPCGGQVIAISVTHRVFDGSSLATFVAAWSESTTSPDKVVGFRPSFDLPKLLPAKYHNFGIASDKFTGMEEIKIVVKRLVFNGEALTSLSSEINKEKPISKVRVVCAFLAKTLIDLDRAKHGRY